MSKKKPSWAAPPVTEVSRERTGPKRPRYKDRLPGLLAHPNLPKPMHGLNPRTVLGRGWWDKQRKAAYAEREFHCWACGVHKLDAEVKQWLEGHEEYDIDYQKGRMTFKRVVALCHLCHNFIHSGRLAALLDSGEITQKFFNQVMKHGLNVLAEADIMPWSGTLEAAIMYGPRNGFPPKHPMDILVEMLEHTRGKGGFVASWGKWRLVLEGKEYPPVHKTKTAWKRAYNVGDPGDYEEPAPFPDPGMF